jgi:hypothetical protein
LPSLLENSTSIASSTGWGSSHIIALGQSKVFVKRVPITNLEYDNLFSTRNFYDLPTYCNYGFGSTGLGVFRELITHIKTTHWVLEGLISNFPLLYHYRVIPCSRRWTEVDQSQHSGYVECWGNSESIGKYLSDRAITNYELVLFLEYIPHVLETWLRENPNQLQQSFNDLRTTINFLRTKEIIHFDTHFRNILTDGEQTYLTDFGLALDKSFTLTEEEAAFFDQHIYYDCGEVLRNLGHLIHPSYNLCSESDKHRIMEKYGIQDNLQPYEVRSALLDNIEQIHADRDLELDESYVSSIVKYRGIIALMQDFWVDMHDNNQKETRFAYAKLKLLLSETGFISAQER